MSKASSGVIDFKAGQIFIVARRKSRTHRTQRAPQTLPCKSLRQGTQRTAKATPLWAHHKAEKLSPNNVCTEVDRTPATASFYLLCQVHQRRIFTTAARVCERLWQAAAGGIHRCMRKEMHQPKSGRRAPVICLPSFLSLIIRAVEFEAERVRIDVAEWSLTL